MIQVENLRKSFGQLVAVDGISFEISDGETFGLLGPNGAGKSTTISMLTGLLKPDNGVININGISDPTKPEVRRNLGTTPQSIALYDDLTAFENLNFFGKFYDLRGKILKQRVEEVLKLTGLTDRKNDLVETYSGGMKRRLNMACSLLHHPKVLLLDEPTVGVDPQSRNLIFDNIEQFKKEGTTILYTTHYMEEAQRLCDRVAIMDHGKIMALDTVPNLIQKHGGKSLIIAEFEKPPQNIQQLPGIWKDSQLKIETDKPLEVVAQLSQLDVQIHTLHIDRANLEDVFLNLTGRSLRDV